jgi:hypothetical protein
MNGEGPLNRTIQKHLGSVEGAPDKGAGSHRFETHFFPYLFIFFELLGRNISFHRQSVRTGLKILADR